ncbi:MAG: serine/threonine protein kinase [Gemmatimonadaceae bacterium]|nr:serine/threonine protein kinase [Gemmatimonadaceae bacterium]
MTDDFTQTLQDALAPGYTLERELSGGGMSRVFVATDTALGRKVVVKVLPPELAAGVNHERFRREIQVAAQLQHPHIVPLLSAGEQGALIWYTMPYINGHSLRDALARGETYSPKDVIRLMREVAEGLEYAHGLGVVHRDIKPGNVLVQGTHALVTDFGVSKAISAAMPTSGYTSAGMAIGTPAYMAPEQIAADPAADHRMDLYALGLLAYELLSGKVPFKEASPQQTMAAQLTRDPEPIEKIRPDVPAPLAALVRQLLAKLPSERPASAQAVVEALDGIPLSGETAAFRAMPRPRRQRAQTAVAALVGLALVAAAWAMGQRQGSEAVVTQLRDSLAAAESLQAWAPTAALLTREDSIAIANAVSERMAARPTPTTTRGRRDDARNNLLVADSIRVQVQRMVLDSLLRRQALDAAEAQEVAAGVNAALQVAGNVLSTVVPEVAETPRVGVRDGPRDGPREGATAFRLAPPEVREPPLLRGPRRVVIAPPRSSRGRPDLDAVAATLVDTLRRAIDTHPRYVAVAQDSVTAALASSRTVNAVQERLDADLIISFTLIPARDSVVRLVQIRDLTAARGFEMRVVSTTVPASDPAGGLDRLVPMTLRTMQQLERETARQTLRPRDPQPPREAPKP